MATFGSNFISTDNLLVNSSISIAGDVGTNKYVIAKQSGTPSWQRMTGLISQYSENTNNTVNLCTGSPVAITFDKENFNFADISFAGTTFTFTVSGLYRFLFQCSISNAGSRSSVGFYLNGIYIYGNATLIENSIGATIISQFSIEHTENANAGDVLTIVGEQISGNSVFLVRNPLNNAAISQLSIERLF
jgi:hypothetical protein